MNDKGIAILLNFFHINLDHIFVLNEQSEIVYVNPQAEKTFRLYEEDIFGKDFWDIELLALKLMSVETSVANDTKEIDSWRIYSKSTDKWFDTQMYPIKNDWTVIVLTDITKHINTKTLLKNLDNEYHTFLKETSDTVFELNAEMNKVHPIKLRGLFTKRMLREDNMALSHEAWVKKFVHPDDQAFLHEEFSRGIRQQRAITFDCRIQEEGVYRWYHADMVPIMNQQGEIFKWIGTVNDITERKLSEEEFLKKEKKYLELLDSTTTGFYVRDFIERKMFLSAEWKKSLGFDGMSEEEIFANHHDRIHPDDLGAIEEYCSRVIQQKECKFSNEYRVNTNNRGCIWVLNQGKVLYDKKGNPMKIYGTHIDITDKKATESALIESEHEGQALIRRLSEANELKKNYIGTLAHELRNPLATIAASVSLLEKKVGNEEKLGTTIDIIKRQTNQLTKFTNDLLSNTKFILDKIQIQKEDVEIVALVQESMEEFMPLYQENDIHLEMDVQVDAVNVRIDPMRMKQVIANLLSNALKFTDVGGLVSVQIRKDEGSNKVLLQFKDTGIGIAEGNLADLFEPFVLIDNSLTRNTTGLGLGLSIVKNIVELHDGDVTVDSKGMNQGTSFLITLPIQ